MREPATGEHIGQTGRQIARGCRFGIVLIGLRLEQRLGTDESGAIRVLAVNKRDQPRLGQLGFAAVANGDFRGAFHVDAAIVRWKHVGRQVLDLAAGLYATDARAPSVFLERAVDVGGHRVGRIHPCVFLALVAVSVFFECEFLNRLGLGAVWQPGERARHTESDITRVVGFAQRSPGGIVRRIEQLAEIARIHQLIP